MSDLDVYKNRSFFVGAVLILIALIYLVKLFIIQVVDPSYRLSASNNVLRYVTQYPSRGLIYDRNHKLVVANQAVYDLMVIPGQMESFDTLQLCEELQLSREEFIKRLKEARHFSFYRPSVFMKQLPATMAARIEEKLYQFPGFYFQPRTVRSYIVSAGAHMLGYVGEVNEKTIKKNPYYQLGDYIGISGIERSYEEALRGRKGVKIFMVDVHNRIKGSYQNGRYDTSAVIGKNLIGSFDVRLQQYGEKLMQNKTGSIVAIEPETGEVLCMVSAPAYAPDLLIGRARSVNFPVLSSDTLKPLFNRAVMASYPPGSTFKVVDALIALQEKVLFPYYKYSCGPGYGAGGIYVGCHIHRSPLDLIGAIQNSCNAYFCNVFRNILDNPAFPTIYENFNRWIDYLHQFGFGNTLGIDVPNELKGYLPSTDYYDRYYGKNHWSSLTLISLAIGQGELGFTPLQMANLSAIIANRGWYRTPHVIREIEGDGFPDETFNIQHHIKIDSTYFETVVKGMDLVVNGEPGTGSTARIARIPDIRVCGKTGTAQNPHGKDHSIFMAFAPRDNPKIAISVYVENGGFGSTYAAPIASLMIEQYLKGVVERKWLEDYILKTDLIHGEKEK
ncbi:MAG: penicillin-binding protein 2 [Chlorobi bacterium]|nr:penicillin-binding protein 2 [Chlorobiota bacterium]